MQKYAINNNKICWVVKIQLPVILNCSERIFTHSSDIRPDPGHGVEK